MRNCIDKISVSYRPLREVVVEGEKAVVWEEQTETRWTEDPQRVYGVGEYAASRGEETASLPVGYARSCENLGEEARRILLDSDNPRTGLEKRLILFRKGVYPSPKKQPMRLPKLGGFSVGQKIRLLSEGKNGREYTLDRISPRYDSRSEKVYFEFHLGFLPPEAFVPEQKIVEGTPEDISRQIAALKPD